MKSLFVFLLLLLVITLKSQSLPGPEFEKLRNDSLGMIRDTKGNLLGCPGNFECRKMQFAFYRVEINASNIVKIEGRALVGPLSDSAGIAAVKIYLGSLITPMKLKSGKLIATSYMRMIADSHSNEFPYRTGDFIIRFPMEKKNKLYFDDPLFRIVEFDVTKLKR